MDETLKRIDELRMLLKLYEHKARLEQRAATLEAKAGKLTELGQRIAAIDAHIGEMEGKRRGSI